MKRKFMILGYIAAACIILIAGYIARMALYYEISDGNPMIKSILNVLKWMINCG